MKISKNKKAVINKAVTNNKGNALATSIRRPQKIWQHIFLTSCLLIFVLFSYLLFDVKPSQFGDDSSYIEMGYNLWHFGTYPGFQGPLYPIILSFFIGMFGINLVLLKTLSCVFLVSFIYFTYNNFKKVFPISLLLLIILFCSINPNFVYYASQTFSESLYVLFTALLIYFFNKFFIAINSSASNKKLLLSHIVTAFFILGCFLVRTAGIATLAAGLLYFIIYRQWKNFLYLFLSFAGIFIIYSFCKKLAFPHAEALQFTSQLKMLSQKDAYSITAGYENASGFITRLWQNSEQYLGGHFLVILGLEPKDYTQNILEKGAVTTSIIYVVIGGSLWFSFKENKLLFFAGLLSIISMLLTFIMVQVSWNQDRLILVHVPYIVMLVAYALYQLFNKSKTLSAGKWLSFILIACMIVPSIKKTIDDVNDFSDERLAVADGNLLYGFTPDYQNYLEMSKWAAAHVGIDSMIGVRKPGIAFIYGQRPFFGIYNIPTVNEQEVINSHTKKGINQYAITLKITNSIIQNLFESYCKYARTFVIWQNAKDAPLQPSTGENQQVTAIFSIPDSLTINFENTAKLLNLNCDTSIKASFDKMYNLNLKPKAYYFQELLDNLKNNKIQYLILASLRSQPDQKTANIVNTLQKYLYILRLKYPALTRDIKIIGTDEASTLVKLEYSNCNY